MICTFQNLHSFVSVPVIQRMQYSDVMSAPWYQTSEPETVRLGCWMSGLSNSAIIKLLHHCRF